MGKIQHLRAADLDAIPGQAKRLSWWEEYQPVNALNGKPYQGSNRDLLKMFALNRAQGQTVNGRKVFWISSYFATWAQWRRLGCRPRQGERPARIYCHNRYHCLWGFWQVSIESEPGPDLAPILDEVSDQEQERARVEGRLTGQDWRAYHWAAVQTDIESRRGAIR